MIIWFAMMAPVIVALVFKSQRLDYRLVSLGAVIPTVSALFGVLGFLNTLLFQAGALGLVMLVTQNRRLVRRRYIGIPIGGLLRLILDASWLQTERLWWPITPESLEELAGFTYPIVPLGLLLEVLGIAIGIWAWSRFGLDDKDRLGGYLKTGQLPRV